MKPVQDMSKTEFVRESMKLLRQMLRDVFKTKKGLALSGSPSAKTKDSLKALITGIGGSPDKFEEWWKPAVVEARRNIRDAAPDGDFLSGSAGDGYWFDLVPTRILDDVPEEAFS